MSRAPGGIQRTLYYRLVLLFLVRLEALFYTPYEIPCLSLTGLRVSAVEFGL